MIGGILKWIVRLAVLGALIGVAVLALNRRHIIDKVEDVTERADDSLRTVEKGLKRAEKKGRRLEEKGEEVKEKVF